MTATNPLPSEVVLNACAYKVSMSEGLIVFGEDGGVWGCRTRFSFERKCGCWYVTIDGTHNDAMVSHVIKAYELVCKTFGGNHEFQNGEHQP